MSDQNNDQPTSAAAQWVDAAFGTVDAKDMKGVTRRNKKGEPYHAGTLIATNAVPAGAQLWVKVSGKGDRLVVSISIKPPR